MSTKDLLEKLKRTSAQSTQRSSGRGQTTRTSRTSANSPGTSASAAPTKTDTRVNKRVIRRKSRTKAPSSDAAPATLKSGSSLGRSSGSASSSSGTQRTTQRRVIRRRPAAAPAPAPASEAVASPAVAPESTSDVVAAEAVSTAETAPAETADGTAEAAGSEFEQMGLGSAVIALPEDYKAPQQPEPEPEAVSSSAEEAPAVEAQSDTTEAAAVESAEVAAEAAPAAEPTPEPAAPEVKNTRQEQFKRMGLGSAVIGLPEGYDPSNPRGHIKSTAPAPRGRETSAPQPDRQAGGSSRRSERGQRRERVFGGSGDGRPDRSRPSRGRGGRRMVGGNAFAHDYKKKSGRKRRGAPKKASPQAKAIKRRVTMESDNITIADLSHAMSVKATEVIRALFGMGLKVRINDNIDIDTARLIAEEFQYEIVDGRFDEDAHLIDSIEKEDEGALEHRDPVITIMGHVDHGKTTLLDTIRRAHVADGEAGGITQHVSAYQTQHNGQTITFIDTPGHEAFTAMRARGAMVTDIVILVVAADDGVMPQTVEALSHAKAAEVPIIVAVNKCDKPEANPDRVRQELMQYELVPEEFGGDTIFVEVSALKGKGIDDLLENILLIAEVQEFQANPNRHAQGYVLEARLEKGRGAVATLLVKKGTLKQGDSVVLGTAWGRVRAMSDYNGKRIKKAAPSMPVEIIGLQDVPNAGDEFVVTESDKDARALAEHRADKARQEAIAASNQPVSLEQLIRQKQEGEKLTLNLILRSDVGGTLEAMKGSLSKIAVPGTEVKVLHSAVGAISEGDITLAHTYSGIIIGFNVRPDSKARRAMSDMGVEVRTYRVIYEALEDVEKALKGMLEPETKEVTQGYAEVKQTFSVPKVGTVAGCLVSEGKIARNQKIRLLRQGEIIWEGRLASLRRFKDDVREVSQGYECGMNLDGFNDLKVGDEIEGYVIEEVERDI